MKPWNPVSLSVALCSILSLASLSGVASPDGELVPQAPATNTIAVK
jgi:hypothetical protein